MELKIRRYALDLLARREHSQSELRDKLSTKGFAFAEINQLLQKLAEQNLQSDQRFAENYIKSRYSRGFGPNKICLELEQRGINQELITQLLDKNNSDWLRLASHLYYKKFKSKVSLTPKEQAKQMRYLYYKGFTIDQIKAIFSRKNYTLLQHEQT